MHYYGQQMVWYWFCAGISYCLYYKVNYYDLPNIANMFNEYTTYMWI